MVRKMPMNYFGCTSGKTSIYIFASSLVQKPYRRFESVKGDFEGDINMKNVFKLKI